MYPDAAVNALSVVDEADAWLDMSQPWLRRHALPGEPLHPAYPCTTPVPGEHEGMAPCLTLAGLRAEQALVRAAVTAAAAAAAGPSGSLASGGPAGEYMTLTCIGSSTPRHTHTHLMDCKEVLAVRVGSIQVVLVLPFSR